MAPQQVTVAYGEILTLTLVNERVPDGQLKLLKIWCKAEKAQAPLFEIVNAGNFAPDKGCWRGTEVTFTVSGGSLTEPITVITDRQGEATLTLEEGTYTVTEVVTGASTTVEVTAQTTTYLTVTNYDTKKPGPTPTPTPTPGKPGEPVAQLPDTGAGTTSTGSMMLLLALLALLLVSVGALLTKTTRRRVRS